MLTLGPLAFAQPWALAALAAAPLVWWLLRLTPPAPSRVAFPPMRLLAHLVDRDHTVQRTPPWLLWLRLALLALVVLAAARPVLNPERAAAGAAGPLVILVDNGWASAARWSEIESETRRLLTEAARADRPVTVVATAAAPAAEPAPAAALTTAETALAQSRTLAPQPWPTDRAAAIERLLEGAREGGWSPGELAWLSDGLDEPRAGGEALAPRIEAAAAGRPISIYRPNLDGLLLLRPSAAGDAAQPPGVVAVRPSAGAEATAAVDFIDAGGALLAQAPLSFGRNDRRAEARADLPAELLRRLTLIVVSGGGGAGAKLLIDEGGGPRTVGLVAADRSDRPLLGQYFYIERALAPFAEIRRGPLADLLRQDLSMIVVADVGRFAPEDAKALVNWVEAGGVLLRFAGPSLAAAEGPDPLAPGPIRPGDRRLGGAMGWADVGHLGSFAADGPFAGLPTPRDVVVERQALAEPGVDVGARTWAQLEDGSPLVSGRASGRGWLVLVHVTANADWSNLPLSGVFVEMLRSIADLGRTGARPAAGPALAPSQTLDGFGALGPPPASARPIPAAEFAKASASPETPPGFYGREGARRALDLSANLPDPTPLSALPRGAVERAYAPSAERDLRSWLWGGALALALLDLAASLWLRGLLRLRPTAAVGVALALVAALAASPASAQTVVRDGSADPAALVTRLAFVRTGDPGRDAISEAGLAGLTQVVNRRTAAEFGAPVGVDPAVDELGLYPVLYWPIDGAAEPLSPAAARRMSQFMRTGGVVLFDVRGGDAGQLRALARALDMPGLVPLAPDHVLRRSYYLLDDAPGRQAGRPVWVEPATETVRDGVAAVIAGSADWAGAWAVDPATRRPMLPMPAGGERQREMAYRFGVNVVMYALTGNYKADQVHLPAILERLRR